MNSFRVKQIYADMKPFTVAKKGFFSGGSVEKKISNQLVDMDDFATKLQNAYAEFDVEGYEVINVVPIAVGESDPSISKSGNYLGDIGYSVTRGALVVGRLRANSV